LDDLVEVAGATLLQVDEVSAADIRLIEDPADEIAVRTHVLVAPFPTLDDEVSLAELERMWRARELGIEAGSAPALRVLLGQGEPAVELPAADLLSWSWEHSALAVIGFDALEPKWKVLSVDGVSPLDYDFDPDAYPLSIGFGVEGEPALREHLIEELAWVPTNRDPNRLSFVAMTGVTALTRATAWAIERNGVEWATAEVGPLLDNADITHVSHEVAFSPDCPPVNPSRDVNRFCGQPEQIAVLERLGVDVVELTGNHVMDFGEDALLYTIEAYRRLGWQMFGGGKDQSDATLPARFEHNGNPFVFLGCNAAGPSFAWATESSPGARRCDLDELAQEIERESEAGWLPIVTFQWPESYRDWPVPEQAEAFRRMADSGAVIVSGSQAHQPQGMEFRGSALIHFGLGNLMFDQMWSLETRQEFIDLHVFYGGRHINTVLYTAMLEDYAQPRLMTPGERTEFLMSIFEASGW
jgi:poly-gamma-glutamate synthesis protein (capsule biosynthesis protein)